MTPIAAAGQLLGSSAEARWHVEFVEPATLCLTKPQAQQECINHEPIKGLGSILDAADSVARHLVAVTRKPELPPKVEVFV